MLRPINALRLFTLLPLALLSACADSAVAVVTPSEPLAVITPAPYESKVDFATWVTHFKARAQAAGIEPWLLTQAFDGLTPDHSVIEADRSQPEFSRPIWEYLEGALSSVRVNTGKRLLAEHKTLLNQIEASYGVDRHTLVAIWGMESNFGHFMGNKSVIRSLATLAHEGRRPQFAEEQLLAALKIIQEGDISVPKMLGSWAGAMGQTQFIPTTYQTHAVDFDGDGRRDIWSSSADALASAAHYLKASGWQKGQPWGLEVTLPEGFDYALADTEIRKPLSEWQALGINLGNVPAYWHELPATLLIPAGYKGPAFLTLPNFRAILRYNNSSAYALGVSYLAERFQNGKSVQGTWPRHEKPLSRSERIQLQEGLNARGYNVGKADSIIGANTRKAVRAFQTEMGLPADGYPTYDLLKILNQAQ